MSRGRPRAGQRLRKCGVLSVEAPDTCFLTALPPASTQRGDSDHGME